MELLKGGRGQGNTLTKRSISEMPICIRHNKIRQSRLNKRERLKIYAWLVLEQGDRCKFCGKTPHELGVDKLEIDHRNGNPKFHYYKNLQLLCHSCNSKKNPKGWKRFSLTDVSVCVFNEDIPRASTAEMYAKMRYMRGFLSYLEKVFSEGRGLILRKEIINEGAVQSGMASQETIKRYLELLCTESGPLVVWKSNYIRLKKDVETIKQFRSKYCE